MLNIYVNTWGNYNENGADGGEWVSLPMDRDELEKKLETIAATMNDSDPEWFINDYEWESDFELGDVSETDNIFTWNERCEMANGLEDWEQAEIMAAIEAFGYDITDAIDRHNQGYFIFYPNMDLEDVAYEIVESCYNLKEPLANYFDYTAFARDLGFDGYNETKYGVICDN